MAQPYVGEIRIFAGNFAPVGWEFCDGQLLPISENETLFQLIGNTYGGDGQNTFAVPDLRGRLPLHQGAGFNLANQGGAESVTLSVSQIPAHSHSVLASTGAGQSSAAQNNVLAKIVQNLYNTNASNLVNMNALMVGPTGGSQPHENRQPFLCLNFIISLFGIFPTQT
jgi:microcystin-dependent protein